MKDSDEYISGEQHQHLKQTRPTRRVTMRVSYITTAVLVVVVAVVGFLLGDVYGKHHSGSSMANGTSAASRSFGGYGGAGGNGMHRGGGFGKVTSVSSSSITVQNSRTNASTTYAITSSTTITDNGQTESASDIQVGDTVIVIPSSSSATTASRILVNPSFGGGFGGGASSSGSNTTGSNSTGSQTTN